jgi:thioredoxin 2
MDRVRGRRLDSAILRRIVDGMIRRCPQCGTDNRVPAKFLAARGRCGSCKGALPAVAEPLDVNAEDFDAIVRDAKVPVFVDFWAAWCGPCRMVAPEVKQLAHDLQGQGIVLKVDTEAQPQLASRFSIQSIPTFIVLQNGRPVGRRAGYTKAADLTSWVRSTGAAAAP